MTTDPEEKLESTEPTERAEEPKVAAASEVREKIAGIGANPNKLKATATYEELEARFPEVAAMRGFDQRSDYHTLTLDEHTKELVRNLEQDPFVQNHPKRDLILLAGALHDIGKMSPEGQQVNAKDPNKRNYVGHEDESARMLREEMHLEEHVDISREDVEFVEKLTGLHASALNLIDNLGCRLFEKDGGQFKLDESGSLVPLAGAPELKGKDLKSFDKFLEKVAEIPGDLELEEKMRIVLALNTADKFGGWNEQSDEQDEKVQSVKSKAERQIKILTEIKKALPALLQAVEARRNGMQIAGVKLENGEYTAINTKKEEKKERAAIPPELKRLGGVLRDKTKAVAEIYETLKARKDNERALQGIVNGVLKKKLRLTDEQVTAVLESLK